MVYKFFDKKSKGSSVNKSLKFNEQLAKKLHKAIIRNLNRRTVYSGFIDNIWGANFTDMQLISKFNKGFRFLFCVIDVFSKDPWVVPLKDKKRVSIVNAFKKTLHKSGRKSNKIWVDKGSGFHNNSFKKWLKDKDIEMYSMHNEGKLVLVVAERFIRVLKTNIYIYIYIYIYI